VSFFCTEWGRENFRTIIELAPPPDVTELQSGDFVQADVELVVLAADARSYYGPDESMRDALSRDADTWQLVAREASGNSLKIQTQRGTVARAYPLVIAVDDQQRAEVTIAGGVGHIPVTVTGLTQPRGNGLFVDDQPVEHWQTDWDPATQRWQVSFNIPTATDDEITLKVSAGSP
jgi:hypothetical protein